MRERELKLAVHGAFVVPNLADDGLGVLTMSELPELALRSTYHDTSDLRLARNGVTLRYRTGEEGGPVWTLKLRVPGHDASERDEHTFSGGPDEVPAGARDLVTALVRSAPILPVAALETRRRRWLLCGPAEQALAELADDEVTVLDGERVVARFRELELESRGPELDALRPIANRLRRAGAVLAEPVPKAFRALGPRAAADPDVVPIAVSPDDPAERGVQAALATGVARLITNDAATRLGEVEGLHQMRVAARRLRSDLRTFRPLLDRDWSAGLSDELRWLGSLLGTVRDADVQLERLDRIAADLLPALDPLLTRFRRRRDDGRGELLAALGSERYRNLLERLVDAVRSPLVNSDAARLVASALPPLVQRAWKALEPEAESVRGGGPEERYHAVRIKVKRVRYAAEAIAPALGAEGRPVGRLAEVAAALQDQLGTMHDDAVMQTEALATVEGHPDPEFALAAGRLIERCAASVAGAKTRYPKLWSKAVRRMRATRKRATDEDGDRKHGNRRHGNRKHADTSRAQGSHRG
ncbi:MAG: CYTH and CHAD domain-containing protein [Chloroflexota bacterium]|nr:CYTH and CHAD domain-containing protein [Chloroflexota bacterium]